MLLPWKASCQVLNCGGGWKMSLVHFTEPMKAQESHSIMLMDGIEKRIKYIIIRALSLEITPEEINDTADLQEEGGLNSLGLVQILVGLENEFGIEIPDEDFRMDVFNSVDTIATYVRRRSLDCR